MAPQLGTALTCSQPHVAISSITRQLLWMCQLSCHLLSIPTAQWNTSGSLHSGTVCPFTSAYGRLGLFRWFPVQGKRTFEVPWESGWCRCLWEQVKGSAMTWSRARRRQELPNPALLQKPSHKVGGSKESWEEVGYHTKAEAEWLHGSQDATVFSKGGTCPSLFHQITLKSLGATAAHHLCTASAANTGQSHLPWASLASFQPSETSFRVNGKFNLGPQEGNLPIQLTAKTLLLLIRADSQQCWGLHEKLMARWSCGYQYDCNAVLGRNFQSIRSRKCLLPSSHGNITTHDHALVANSSLLSYTRHGLPWWSNNHFTQYGLDSAVSKLQFPQECLEFPPLCNTHLAGSRFDEWISSFTREVFPHTCYLFEQSKAPA